MITTGWLTTKKRGRDDDLITRDRQAALAARRQHQRSRPTKVTNKSPQRRENDRKSKKKKKKEEEDFLVDESSDESMSEKEWNENSEEEEEEEDDEEKENGTGRRMQDGSSSSSDNDDDDDDNNNNNNDLFRPYQPRRQRVPTKDEHKRKDTVAGMSTSSSSLLLLARKPDTLSCLHDFDSPADHRSNRNCQVVVDVVDGDVDVGDDDHSLSNQILQDTPTPDRKPRAKRKYRDTKSSAWSTTRDDPVSKRSHGAVKQAMTFSAAAAIVSTDASLDEEVEDEDEAIALAWAMEQSRKEASRKQQGKTATTSDSTKQQQQQQPISLLVDTDAEEEVENDEGEAEDCDQDVYVDEDARAAGSVLETANELSKRILSNMASWSETKLSNVTNGNTSATAAVPLGMIVDGALALTTLQEGSASSSSSSSLDHKFISKQEMAEICPNVTLADYQLIGVNWMALLHGMKCEVEGSKSKSTSVNGVLADSMGLGKTVQTIAFLSWLRHSRTANKLSAWSEKDPIVVESDDEREDRAVLPHLVVAPASVLSNWEREFQKFAPHLKVVTYHGSQAERRMIQDELNVHLPSKAHMRKRLQVQPVDVILSPITYFQKEQSDDRVFLRRFKYDYMVVDEAHLLKNARGLRYKYLDRFTTQHRLLLTGTPVQNSPKELLALLCFLMPLFSRDSGEDSFDKSSENDGGESMLQHFVQQEGCSDEVAYRKLKQLFAPFVLRRKKEDVLSQILPPKERKVEFVQLDPVGRSLYDSILSDHVKAKKKGNAASREHLFTQLRKAAHHPLLIRARHKTPAEKMELARVFHRYGAFQGQGCTLERVTEEIEKYNDFQVHLTALELIEENPHRRKDLERYILDEADLFCSAKFARLRSLLPDMVKAGHRILIFSVWTSCLDLLSCLMESLDLKYLRMDGSTPVPERQGLIDEFSRDDSIPVFLLSTKACGLGINLTAADTCIMHDLDFNPFNDLQAEDRCHRIGATKPVTIIKMVSKDTVDEDIYAMQQRKAKMNAAILESSSSDWNKEAAKEKAIVLQTAVDRFLRSPMSKAASADGKENQIFERDNL